MLQSGFNRSSLELSTETCQFLRASSTEDSRNHEQFLGVRVHKHGSQFFEILANKKKPGILCEAKKRLGLGFRESLC